MTKSSLTNRVQLAVSSQHSSRQGAVVDTVLWHHMASTAGQATTDGMQKGSLPVSANYTILDDGTLILVVDEDRRAHTSGSPYDGGKGAAWDRRSITIEIENETGAPGWGISKAALTTAARLQADLRKRYTIRNVFGHRDLNQKFGASYATFCPGPNTVARILELEKSLGGSVASAPVDTGWPYAWHTVVRGDTLSAIARKYHMSLSRLRRLNPAITEPTKLQIGARVKVAVDQVPVKLVEDNILGPETWGQWQRVMGATVTRAGGRDFLRRLQRHMNGKRRVPIPVTGLLDDATITALAEWVNADKSVWVKKLQWQLNNGQWT